jgi:superfamily II DNA/RNA helicase
MLDLTQILNKFEIKELNQMQVKASQAISSNSDVVLLSPTGTGKTLAFLLPLIDKLDEDNQEIQVLILVPSRELAQQVEQVARKIGSGFKVNSVYGGRSGSQDKMDIKHRPAILIGTPGRVADRIRRDNINLEHIKTLILDEFDKSLEIGYEKEMTEIIETLPNVKQRILTSATNEANIPKFVGLQKAKSINYLPKKESKLEIKILNSSEKDKLKSLGKALDHIGNQPGIIFCNFKDAIERVSNFLSEKNIDHLTFHGGMEQIERELALVKFRNGSNQLLLATDLAARGLDIPEINFIIHYHLPIKDKEFIHRNGRTARMNKDGVAYVLHYENETLPDFIDKTKLESIDIDSLEKSNDKRSNKWTTLHITGGRRDKISKGDIVGLFLKQGGINKDQLGIIELTQSQSYVSVDSAIAKELIQKLNNSKLKKRKVKISLI